MPRTYSLSGPLTEAIDDSGNLLGDQSISHCLLIFSALAVGESMIEGLPENEDVLVIAAALQAMGAGIEIRADRWHVHGVGVGGLLQPETALDMGDSTGATMLLMGLVASHPITATFIGAAAPSLQIIEPLSRMGAAITTSPGGWLPLMIRGICPAVPIEYRLPVAYAALKSAILLAGLNTPGITQVIDATETIGDLERMLIAFGADLGIETDGIGVRTISLRGEADLKPAHMVMHGESSLAGLRT
jgi:3-phosphoshikimate 1-carboxyvinyltransferase